LGFNAGSKLTTCSHNIDIGNEGVAGESATIRIGTAPRKVGKYGQTRTFVAGINGVAVTGSPVYIGGSGQLGTAASSQRFKDDIKPMDKASEAILALKPVTFH
jgi:trimeric autotransporter adhesin